MKNGVIYTPKNIVEFMLNRIGYNNSNILKKHIIDNSCGNGAFLLAIAQKYIKEYKKKNNSLVGIEFDLEKYIHGIEISRSSYNYTIKKLNDLLFKNKINKIKWNILNNDSTKVKIFNKRMDFVVGNPPYIRIHDMDKDLKNNFSLSSRGMTDLYIIFFEIGMNMLNENGKMIYISPNSFFNSKAGNKLRKYFYDNNLLNAIFNLGHYNPFANVTTYTAITLLNNKKQTNISYFYNYDGEKILNRIKYNNYEFFFDNVFYFSSLENIDILKKMNRLKNNKVTVKNGISTNLDSFFINEDWIGKHVRKIYKISTGKYSKIIFPYDEESNLINIKNFSIINNKKFMENKQKLIKRDLRGQEWYAFARTQGIKDTFKNKICINSVIKNIKSIKLKAIEKGVPVYSGYYIIYNEKHKDEIVSLIKNKKFIDYIKTLNKEKNGKYYFFSSKDLEKYLNYYLN